MAKTLTSRPVRYCKYRYCIGSQEISEFKRSDSEYCCYEHGYMERNAKKHDDIVLQEYSSKLKDNRRILKDLFIRRKRKGMLNVLDALGFEFKILTEIISFNKETKTFCYGVFEYELEITPNNYSIKKKDQNENN